MNPFKFSITVFLLVTVSSMTSAQEVYFIESHLSTIYSSAIFKDNSDLGLRNGNSPKICWNTSILVGVKFESEIFIKTGIEIGSRGYFMPVSNLDSTSIEKFDRYSFAFPILIGKQFCYKNIILEPYIGMKYERLAGISMTAFNNTTSFWFNKLPEGLHLNKNLLYASFGLEAVLNVNSFIDLVFGPQFDIALNNEFYGKDIIIEKHLYSIGMNIGLKYNM